MSTGGLDDEPVEVLEGVGLEEPLDHAHQVHPRSDARQSQESISKNLTGTDAKSGFKLPER